MSDFAANINIPQIGLPKGGGAIKGIGETFQPTPFTGTASFSIPINTPTARELSPDLSLSYGSGTSQGVFGMGFGLSVPNITRRTERRLPDYSDADEFVLSDAAYLVPALEATQSVEFSRAEQSNTYRVRRYRPRTEGRFLRIEQWTREGDGDVHWRVTTPENVTSRYGQSSAARIVHPEMPGQIFSWLLEVTEDAKGNRIEYSYKAEDGAGLLPSEGARSRQQKYIHTIRYGNYWAGDQQRWAFSIVFDYGEYGLSSPSQASSNQISTVPQRDWLRRDDAFSDYRAGFEIRTHRLCQNILVFHHFPDELQVEDCLVRAVQLRYQSASALSFLAEIQEVGYRRQANGTYETQALPPLQFQYTQYQPQAQQFQPLTGQKLDSLPLKFETQGYQLLDLYGEGIAGILYDHQGTTLYWRSQGNGTYATPHEVAAFPAERNSPDDVYALTDGLFTQLITRNQHRAGYYQLASETTWEGFRAYETVPIDHQRPDAEFADVTGDGWPDLLLFEADRVKVYPSARNQGHHPAISALPQVDFPLNQTDSAEEVLLFADMGGDGLSDRVRIRNGEVIYWPNLGYGKFGPGIAVDNAPWFGDGLDKNRLFLADIDGSGTADVIYAESRRVRVYFNQSGNRFSDPVEITLPAPYESLSQIQFADIRGNGTNCLVFSYGTQSIRHTFYDFTGNQKPHLLTQIDNQRGAITRIHYAPSTQFYLADQQANRPWLSRLPFPVNLMEKTEVVDLIAGSKQVSRYAYHHGAYDYQERMFAGFGLVERWDSEAFEQFVADPLLTELALEQSDQGLHQPPIYTKTWYHTGLAEREQTLSLQFEGEYYKGDTNALAPQDSDFEGSVTDANSVSEAYLALRGKVLREEVYGVDDLPEAAHPYQVKDYSYRLRLIQPATDQHRSVYLPLRREHIIYQYDRNPSDPRIAHTFFLAHDAYGQLIRQAEIAYGRRSGMSAHRDQQQSQGRYQYQQFIEPTDGVYQLGLLATRQTFELQGLRPDLGDYYSWQTLADQYGNVEQTAIDFHEVDASAGARLIQWQDYFYCDESNDSGSPLPWGQVGRRALLHHVETAVYTPEGITATLQGSGATEIDAKLRSTAAEGGALRLGQRAECRYYYMDVGNTAHYGGASLFYQPMRYVDQFGTKTTVGYDRYAFSVVKIETKLSNTQSHLQIAHPDYIALQPAQTIDINHNFTDYRYDPLGNVRWLSRYGQTDSQRRGDQPLPDDMRVDALDLPTILANPQAYLQNATRFFYYDLSAWQTQRQPLYSISVQRTQYSSDLGPGETSPLEIQLTYTDGLGRLVQTKQQVEPGEAFEIQPDSLQVTHAIAPDRWLTSGRTVYNNKGLVIKQYAPFYSDQPQYQPEAALTEFGVTAIRHYDPLGRVRQIDLPKGFITRTDYGAWLVRDHDANDTILSAPYNAQFDQLSDDEKMALQKARAHSDTPTEQWLDVWGRPFLTREWLTAGGEPLVTYTQLDILGNRLRLQDPRLSGRGGTSTAAANFEIAYDMAGRPIRQIGADSGTRWTLYNAGGDPIHRWDSRGFQVRSHYDALSRPTETWVIGNGLNHQVVRLEYGEDLDPQGNNNLRGQISAQYDAAGRIEFKRYSLDQIWEERHRQLRQTYKTEPDWSQDERLENHVWIEQHHHDALGRQVSKVLPDNSQLTYDYHPSNRLNAVTLQAEGEDAQPIVAEISYSARSQREQITYGNGTQTTYRYDAETFNLQSLQTLRTCDNRRLQDIQYVYDPMGNVVRIRDRTHESVFNNNQVVHPQLDYTYDALYRLTQAQGREHPGLHRQQPLPNYAEFLPLNTNVNNTQALQNYTRSYTYDLAGNLTRLQHNANQNAFTRNFTISPTSNRGAIATEGAAPPLDQQYDASGNLIHLDHLREIRWNYRNQLAAVDVIQRENADNDAEYYSYDVTGQRIRKVYEQQVNGQMEINETLYFGDFQISRIRRGTQILQERQTVRVTDRQEPLAIAHRWPIKRNNNTPDRQLRYQLGTHQGSTALELDSTGQIITYEEYYPFGGTALIAAHSQQEIQRKRYRYSGRERDDVTQLYYYGARYYAPWMGRWLSPDPAGPVDGLNLYAFVGNNPVSAIDSGGLFIRQLPRHNPNIEVVNPGGSGVRQPVRVAQGNVRDKIQFFEAGGNRPAPPQGAGAAEAQTVIKPGRVKQRRAFFETLANAQNNPARRAGPSPGAAEARSVIRKGIVAGGIEQFEPPSNQSNVDPPSGGAASSSTTLSIATDINTAVVIAAAILVALELIEQRRDLQKAQQRNRLYRFRNLNQETKRFDRSQSKAVKAKDDDDSLSESESGDDRSGDDVERLRSLSLPNEVLSQGSGQDPNQDQEQEIEQDAADEQDSANDLALQATASTIENRRRR